jgi:drug/metabolite transporter (DMT)-like permease
VLSAQVSLVVLGAALLHAAWNATAHRIPDQAVGFALIGIAITVVPALLLPVAGLPGAAAWPYLCSSAAVHVGYTGLLLASYRAGDFAHVYPLARGTAPLVVALLSVTVVGRPLCAVDGAGVVTLTAGLAILALAGGALRRTSRRASLAAVATGLAIAGYTTIDGVGVHAASTPLAYTAWLFLLQGPWVPVAVLVARRGRLRMPAGRWALGLASGVVSLVAYGLVIWAQAHGSLAQVAALRETSILFGALIGVLLFSERFGRQRLLGAAITLAGVLLLTVG